MKATTLQNRIIRAHLQARLSGTFDLETVKTVDELKEAILSGKTIRKLLDEIEIRFCSITSIILASASTFNHLSQAYNRDIRKGFVQFLSNQNIK